MPTHMMQKNNTFFTSKIFYFFLLIHWFQAKTEVVVVSAGSITRVVRRPVLFPLCRNVFRVTVTHRCYEVCGNATALPCHCCWQSRLAAVRGHGQIRSVITPVFKCRASGQRMKPLSRQCCSCCCQWWSCLYRALLLRWLFQQRGEIKNVAVEPTLW